MKTVFGHMDGMSCGTTQAAKMLQVSVGTIHHMVDRGELDAWLTSGGHRRIPLDSIKSCQLRRRMKVMSMSRSPSQRLSIVSLISHEQTLASLKLAFTSDNGGTKKNITFFSNPMQMLMELDLLMPQLVVLDQEALRLLGGPSWFSDFRKREEYKQIHLLMVGNDLNSEEKVSILINNVNVIDSPLDVAWFKGYIQAIETFWQMACQD